MYIVPREHAWRDFLRVGLKRSVCLVFNKTSSASSSFSQSSRLNSCRTTWFKQSVCYAISLGCCEITYVVIVADTIHVCYPLSRRAHRTARCPVRRLLL